MKKLNKAIKVCCLSFIFLLAVSTSGYSDSSKIKLDLKISGGLSYLKVGNWNEHHLGWNESRRLGVEAAGGTVLSENQALHWGKEMEAEFIFNLSPRFAVSAGAGYVFGKVADTAETLVDNVTAKTIHDFKLSAMAVKAGAYYFIPLSQKTRLFLNAGLGYYFAKFDRFYRRQPGTGYWIDSDMTGTGGDIGIHGGIGFEYSISDQVAIIFEGYGRYAKIKGLEGSRDRIDSNNWSDSLEGSYYTLERERSPWGWFTVVNIAETAPGGAGTRNVRDTEGDFSGFSIRVGLRIRLF